MPEAVLEFKAQDGAWYAGIAAFEGRSLRVHFEHFPDEEDERWSPDRFKSPKDVKKMIRPASQPMQDTQCSGLRCGMFLCVACRRPGTECFEYYDAELQQLHRSPHKRLLDGQECCMCQFEVKWLGGPFLQKRQFVTCGDICLRTPGDVEDDPVIKEYIAGVKSSMKALKNLSSLERNASLTSNKRTTLSLDDDKMRQQVNGRDDKDQSMLESDQKGFEMSLQCGVSSNLMGAITVAHSDRRSPEKAHFNTVPKDNISEPFLSCRHLPLENAHLNTQLRDNISEPYTEGLNVSAKGHVDVIQIDSDEEEEDGTVKDGSATNITEPFSHSKLEDKKFNDDKMENDDIKPQATSSGAKRSLQSPLVDELSTHDFSGLSKEHTFSCGGNVAACSCIALQRHHFQSCECEAVGFIPISPCHLKKTCSHSKWGLRRCKRSCRRARKSGHVCAFSAASQVCSMIDHSQADKAIHGQTCEEGGDSKESIEDEDLKGLFHFLLVENLEEDILPSKALKTVHKVSSGAVMVYIWPSLEYETTRRGYIFYQDLKAAEAAYFNFSTGKFIIVSSKGRPWVVSRVQQQKLDWIQLYNIRSSEMVKEENNATGEGNIEHEDLVICYKGTDEYITAIGKQKLFLAQHEKLRLFYKKFRAEERALESFD